MRFDAAAARHILKRLARFAEFGAAFLTALVIVRHDQAVRIVERENSLFAPTVGGGDRAAPDAGQLARVRGASGGEQD